MELSRVFQVSTGSIMESLTRLTPFVLYLEGNVRTLLPTDSLPRNVASHHAPTFRAEPS